MFSQLDQVNGPVYVESAMPGDTLQIDVLDISVAEWGWTGILNGFGILADEFPVARLKIWDLREKEYTWFDKEKGIKIPIRPFCGEMGVAMAEKGPHSTIPPYKTGGNIDTKHLTKGSTLYLPVEVEGALFAAGVRIFSFCGSTEDSCAHRTVTPLKETEVLLPFCPALRKVLTPDYCL